MQLFEPHIICPFSPFSSFIIFSHINQLYKYIDYTRAYPFKKYCHTYEFPHTYGNIFFRMPAFLSGKLFYSCRLLGLMQAIHTSAVRSRFCRIECHFSQNCCCNIFLFAAYHTTHLPFHFNCKYILFFRFFPFNVEIPTQHVIFPAIISIPILKLYICLNYRYMRILFTCLACWSILGICVRMIHEP